MLFAEKLRELREKKGFSQKALAEESKQPQQSIARWENGESIPAFDAVQSLCAALGVSCTVFDGLEHGEIEGKRGRGRPGKAEPAPKPRKKK